jgi:hypothetical protein
MAIADCSMELPVFQKPAMRASNLPSEQTPEAHVHEACWAAQCFQKETSEKEVRFLISQDVSSTASLFSLSGFTVP